MKKPVTTPLNQGFKMSKLGFSKAQSTVQKKYSNFKTKSRKPVYHKNVIPIDKYKKPKNDPNDKPPGGAA